MSMQYLGSHEDSRKVFKEKREREGEGENMRKFCVTGRAINKLNLLPEVVMGQLY